MSAAVELTIHIRTICETNVREPHFARSARAKKQKKAAWLPCYVLDREPWVGPKPAVARNVNIRGGLAPWVQLTVPLTVTLTRVAPSRNQLDDDNAVSSMKHVRDAIADCLNVDDRDYRLTFRVYQRVGLPEQHDVIVRIEPTPECEWKPAPVKRARKKRAA